MIIVDGDHDDATVDQIVTEVDTWVQGENGSLVKTDNFFFQAEDGIRDCLLSRGLGDVYKRQIVTLSPFPPCADFDG